MRLCCPTCEREIEWSEAYPYRPFCSERCRLIDLGAWLSEKRAIAGKDTQLSDEGDDDPFGSGGRAAGPGLDP